MSWESVLLPMVRVLAGDTSSTPVYTDDRILQAIVVSGLMVAQEFPLIQTYSINLEVPEISPDPTDADSLDPEFVALVGLKSACLLSFNNYNNAVINGVGTRVKSGADEVDLSSAGTGYLNILKLGPCSSYDKLLRNLSIMRGQNLGTAVMSPYSGPNGPNYGNYRNGNWWGLYNYFGF